jgi:hypothetical protein
MSIEEGRDYRNWSDDALDSEIRIAPASKHLEAIRFELDRRKQAILDRENQERDATDAKRHTETVDLAEKSIGIGKAAQRTNYWILVFSFAALVAAFGSLVRQYRANKGLATPPPAAARVVPATNVRPSQSPTPSTQRPAEPEISPSTPL